MLTSCLSWLTFEAVRTEEHAAVHTRLFGFRLWTSLREQPTPEGSWRFSPRRSGRWWPRWGPVVGRVQHPPSTGTAWTLF